MALKTTSYQAKCIYIIMSKVMLLTHNVYRLMAAYEKKETKITPNYVIGIA